MLARFFEDERNAAAEAVLPTVADRGASVPALWPFAIADVLVMAE